MNRRPWVHNLKARGDPLRDSTLHRLHSLLNGDSKRFLICGAVTLNYGTAQSYQTGAIILVGVQMTETFGHPFL